MDEHERLRRLAATLIMELSEAGWEIEADNVQDAMSWMLPDDPATVERLSIVEPQWQDAPDGDGLYWASILDPEIQVVDDEPRLVAVYDDADGVTWVFDHAAGCGYTLATYPARLWSRLPDPPPVPADDTSTTPSPSPEACNLPLRAPFIGPDETCERCGQQAQVHRYWRGAEVQRG